MLYLTYCFYLFKKINHKYPLLYSILLYDFVVWLPLKNTKTLNSIFMHFRKNFMHTMFLITSLKNKNIFPICNISSKMSHSSILFNTKVYQKCVKRKLSFTYTNFSSEESNFIFLFHKRAFKKHFILQCLNLLAETKFRFA